MIFPLIYTFLSLMIVSGKQYSTDLANNATLEIAKEFSREMQEDGIPSAQYSSILNSFSNTAPEIIEKNLKEFGQEVQKSHSDSSFLVSKYSMKATKEIEESLKNSNDLSLSKRERIDLFLSRMCNVLLIAWIGALLYDYFSRSRMHNK